MSLQVWLPLNGTIKNRGIANIKFNNTGVTVDSNGKIGKCYYFDNTHYLYEDTYDWSNFNTSTFSIACWYKESSSATSNNDQMVCIGTSSGWGNIRIGLLKRYTTGVPMFSVSDGTSYIAYNCPMPSFPLDVWNHIAVTYNNGKVLMYLNGELVKTYSTTIVPVLNSSQHLGVGAALDGSEALSGYLNDVRIYDHALSKLEVKKISQALVAHYKLDGFNNNLILDGNIQKGNSYWLDWRSTSTGNAQPTRTVVERNNKKWLSVTTDGVSGVWVGWHQETYTYGYDIEFKENTNYTISAVVYATTEVNGRLWLHFRSSAGGSNIAQSNSTIVITTEPKRISYTFNTGSNTTYPIDRFNLMIGISNNTSDVTGYFTDIKLEEGLIASDWSPNFEETGFNALKIVDSSGYGWNGTANKILSKDFFSPRHLSCTQFDGSTTYIDLGSQATKVKDAITLSYWAYLEDWSSWSGKWGRVISNTNGGGFTIDRTGNCIRMAFGTGESSNTYKYNTMATAFTSLASGWHHFVFTFDGLIGCVYLDGVLDSTITYFTTKTPLFYYETNSTLIGAEASSSNKTEGTYFWHGKLSDIRIYATALSPEDIKSLYEIPALISRQGDWAAFSFVEDGENNISKNGVVHINEISEVGSGNACIDKTGTYKGRQFIER